MINDPSQPAGADDLAATAVLTPGADGAGPSGPPPPPGIGIGVTGDGASREPSIDISEEMRTSYLGYAMSTIVSRALPDARDGLKPVQRRILYAMRELGLGPNSRHLKSAKVVGECFVAGTLVSTPGGLVPIEALNVGDQVYTQTGVQRVTETYIMPAQPLLEVELSGGRSSVCTPGQMFKILTPELETVWKTAEALAPGEFVLSRAAAPATSDHARHGGHPC
jgi:DNA gyrase subunit A